MDKKTEQSLNSALVSAKMEGFQITPTVEADCIMIVNGELSISDYIKRVTEANAPMMSKWNMPYSLDSIADNCYAGTTVCDEKGRWATAL